MKNQNDISLGNFMPTRQLQTSGEVLKVAIDNNTQVLLNYMGCDVPIFAALYY